MLLAVKPLKRKLKLLLSKHELHLSFIISETTCRNACTTTTIQVQDSYSPSCWKVAGDFLKSAGKAALFCKKQASKNPSGFWTSLPALAVARPLPGMTVYETNQQIPGFGWIWVQDGFDSRVCNPGACSLHACKCLTYLTVHGSQLCERFKRIQVHYIIIMSILFELQFWFLSIVSEKMISSR
jgi:hypothetical protein